MQLRKLIYRAIGEARRVNPRLTRTYVQRYAIGLAAALSANMGHGPEIHEVIMTIAMERGAYQGKPS